MTTTTERPRPSIDFAAARRAMIDSQLRTSGVNAGYVLQRMGTVPREDFVPESVRGFAYMDRSLPLGEGRFLAPPLTHGRMLEEAKPRPEDKVLLVGEGDGYFAELLRPLVSTIDAIAPEEALKKTRAKGDYDLLVIDGAVEAFPTTLTKRLADNARVVTGIVRDGVTRLAFGRKAAGEVSLWPLAELGVPRLAEFDRPKEWSF